MAHPQHPFKVIQHDRVPIIAGTLRREDDGERVNLAAGSLAASQVRFQMRPSGAATLLLDVQATMLDATNGEVGYPWVSGDTALCNRYEGRFRAHYAAGASLLQTFPNQGWIPITIASAGA